jgi:hypothetical protein
MKIESIAVCRFNGDTAEPVLLDIAHNMAEYGFFQKGPAKEFLNFATRTLAKRLAGEGRRRRRPRAYAAADPAASFHCCCAQLPPPPLPYSLNSAASRARDTPRSWHALRRVPRQAVLCGRPCRGARSRARERGIFPAPQSHCHLRAARRSPPRAQGLSAIAVCDKEYPSRVALSMLKDLVNEMKTGEHACVGGVLRAREASARQRCARPPALSAAAPSPRAAPSGAAPPSRARARCRG